MIAVLRDRYGLQDSEIFTLRDQEANRAAIITGIEDYLVKDAGPGKTFLFYFAGHGSQVRVKGTDSPEQIVETIVPADAWRGALDIPDKLLRLMFNKVLDAGSELVIIMDSCHSGGATRGPTIRSAQLTEQPLDLPDDPGPPLEDRGALQLLASQASQPAREIHVEGVPPMGAFTSFLVRELRAARPSESAQQIVDRVRGMLLAYSFYQRPVLLGTNQRRNSPVLSSAESGSEELQELPQVMVTGYESGKPLRVMVAAGPDRGIYSGSVLRITDDRGGALELVVEETPALNSSIARFVVEPEINPELPQWAEITRLSAPPIEPLKVWLPATSDDGMDRQAAERQRLLDEVGDLISQTDGLEQVVSSDHADLVLSQSLRSDSGLCYEWRFSRPRGLLALLPSLETDCHSVMGGNLEIEQELLTIWRLVSLDSLQRSSSLRDFPWRFVSESFRCPDSDRSSRLPTETCFELRLVADEPERLEMRLELAGGKRFMYLWSIDDKLQIQQFCPNPRTQGCPEPPAPYGEIHPTIPLFQMATDRPTVLFGVISRTPINESFMTLYRSDSEGDSIGFDLGNSVFETRNRSSRSSVSWFTEVIPLVEGVVRPNF
jgi:hypothetical protein